MPLHSVRPSIRTLRHAATRALGRLARWIEPREERDLTKDGAPAHWLKDIRAYGGELNWITFAAQDRRRQRTPAIRHRPATQPDSERRVGSERLVAEHSTSTSDDRSPDEGPTSAPVVDRKHAYGRIRFPVASREETWPEAGDQAQQEQDFGHSQPGSSSQNIRISYSPQILMPAYRQREQQPAGLPITKAGHDRRPQTPDVEREIVQAAVTSLPDRFPDDPWFDSNAPGDFLPTEWGTRREWPPLNSQPEESLERFTTRDHTNDPWMKRERRLPGPEISIEQAIGPPNIWPEFTGYGDRIERHDAVSDEISRQRDEWSRRKRLESEHRGIEWNESSS
jgi:hypothetical protein